MSNVGADAGRRMSAKWIRSKAWDDRHLTGPLLPVKFALRAFSSIWLSVLLLSLVAIYGILASIPIGLIALLPTWLLYGATLVAAVGIGAGVPVMLVNGLLRSRGVGLPVRFVVVVCGLIGLAAVSGLLWHELAWPMLRYDEVTGKGVRFFADFVWKYKAVQLRRVPGLEMNEMEFYGWWPLSLVLMLFVINMVTATLRRIEFVFVNLGVLSVHTGIVMLALGSAFYATHKQEGDVLLGSGGVTAKGEPIPGQGETGFYDNIRPALWVANDRVAAWEHRALEGLPRYNDYNLGVVAGYEPPEDHAGDDESAHRADVHRDYGPLDVRLPAGLPETADRPAIVDPDVTFRVVGYASYAELTEKWVPAASGGTPGTSGVSMRELQGFLRPTGQKPSSGEKPAVTWRLIPEIPTERVASVDILNVEYTRAMSPERWRDLAETLPAGAASALVVEIPAAAGDAPYRGVFSIEPEKKIAIGSTGWMLEVKQIAPDSPFPIITKGYRGAKSSVAILRVTPPPASGIKPFDRWVYSRFPEISQDLLDETNDRGMPVRKDADARIRLGFIDASVMQVYADEQADGTVRVLSRLPRGAASVKEHLKEGDEVQLAPQLAMRIGPKAANVRRVEVPRVVPDGERDKGRIGNHQAAAIALEVGDKTGLRQVLWVPYTQYPTVDGQSRRRVTLGDGRELTVSFARVRHEFFPPMSVRLIDFQMVPYPHSDTPRDYRSELAVDQLWGGGGGARTSVHTTSLNEPLLVRTPFVPRDDVPLPWLVNLLARATSLIAPNQYKFSQAGWDQGGWRETAAAAARGQAPRPWARFTILGVGSNPGIYIIATGAVIMACGIPWAFYVKPWIVRLRKRKIQKELALAGGTGKRGTKGTSNTAKGGSNTNGVREAAGEHEPESAGVRS